MRDVDDYCLKNDYTSTVETSLSRRKSCLRQSEHAAKARNLEKHVWPRKWD